MAEQCSSAAALREALEKLLAWLDKHGNSFSYSDGTPSDEVKAIWQERQEIVAQCRAALAEPPRNCERFRTEGEAYAEFGRAGNAFGADTAERLYRYARWLFAKAEGKETSNG